MPGNPVNDGMIEFFQAAIKSEQPKKKDDLPPGMISSKDVAEFGTDDDDFDSLDFSDYS